MKGRQVFNIISAVSHKEGSGGTPRNGAGGRKGGKGYGWYSCGLLVDVDTEDGVVGITCGCWSCWSIRATCFLRVELRGPRSC